MKFDTQTSVEFCGKFNYFRKSYRISVQENLNYYNFWFPIGKTKGELTYVSSLSNSQLTVLVLRHWYETSNVAFLVNNPLLWELWPFCIKIGGPLWNNIFSLMVFFFNLLTCIYNSLSQDCTKLCHNIIMFVTNDFWIKASVVRDLQNTRQNYIVDPRRK